MCDQVINEHFRRSLGEAYVNVFSTSKKQDNQVIDNQTSSKESEDANTKEPITDGRISPSPLSGKPSRTKTCHQFIRK